MEGKAERVDMSFCHTQAYMKVGSVSPQPMTPPKESRICHWGAICNWE